MTKRIFPLGAPYCLHGKQAVWDSPEITDTFLNADRARRVRNGKYPKKVWSRVKARSGQASNAAGQRSRHGCAGPGRANVRFVHVNSAVQTSAMSSRTASQGGDPKVRFQPDADSKL